MMSAEYLGRQYAMKELPHIPSLPNPSRQSQIRQRPLTKPGDLSAQPFKNFVANAGPIPEYEISRQNLPLRPASSVYISDSNASTPADEIFDPFKNWRPVMDRPSRRATSSYYSWDVTSLFEPWVHRGSSSTLDRGLFSNRSSYSDSTALEDASIPGPPMLEPKTYQPPSNRQSKKPEQVETKPEEIKRTSRPISSISTLSARRRSQRSPPPPTREQTPPPLPSSGYRPLKHTKTPSGSSTGSAQVNASLPPRSLLSEPPLGMGQAPVLPHERSLGHVRRLSRERSRSREPPPRAQPPPQQPLPQSPEVQKVVPDTSPTTDIGSMISNGLRRSSVESTVTDADMDMFAREYHDILTTQYHHERDMDVARRKSEDYASDMRMLPPPLFWKRNSQNKREVSWPSNSDRTSSSSQQTEPRKRNMSIHRPRNSVGGGSTKSTRSSGSGYKVVPTSPNASQPKSPTTPTFQDQNPSIPVRRPSHAPSDGRLTTSIRRASLGHVPIRRPCQSPAPDVPQLPSQYRNVPIIDVGRPAPSPLDTSHPTLHPSPRTLRTKKSASMLAHSAGRAIVGTLFPPLPDPSNTAPIMMCSNSISAGMFSPFRSPASAKITSPNWGVSDPRQSPTSSPPRRSKSQRKREALKASIKVVGASDPDEVEAALSGGSQTSMTPLRQDWSPGMGDGIARKDFGVGGVDMGSLKNSMLSAKRRSSKEFNPWKGVWGPK